MLSRSPEAHSLLQQQCDEQLRLGGEEKRGGVGPEPLDRHLTSNCFHRILFLTATFQRRHIVFRTAGGLQTLFYLPPIFPLIPSSPDPEGRIFCDPRVRTLLETEDSPAAGSARRSGTPELFPPRACGK